MKQTALWTGFALTLMLLATPARAQYDQYDPCFDVSMNKTQYEGCAVDSGGYSGSGGGRMPPCMSCVTGDDGTGVVMSWCKDANVYLPTWPQYSNCQAYQTFYISSCGCPIYETGCTGTLCLRA
jgi:hypothetical protein